MKFSPPPLSGSSPVKVNVTLPPGVVVVAFCPWLKMNGKSSAPGQPLFPTNLIVELLVPLSSGVLSRARSRRTRSVVRRVKLNGPQLIPVSLVLCAKLMFERERG